MGFNSEHAPITVLVTRTSLACTRAPALAPGAHRHPGDGPAFALDLAGLQPGPVLGADVARHIGEVSAGLGR
jgi:hypothetical protein